MMNALFMDMLDARVRTPSAIRHPPSAPLA
jgi:hypothetical protein